IKLQIEAIKFFEDFDKEFGAHAEFIQAGYIFLVSNPELKQTFSKNLDLQRSMGLNVRALTKDDIKKIAPYVNTDDIIYATFCQTDGYADPHGVTHGISNKCKDLGVHFYFSEEVSDIEYTGSQVKAFITTKNKFEGGLFYNCAGAWSGELAKKADSEVNVFPIRRMLFFTKELPSELVSLQGIIPMTVDMDTGFYMRKEGKGLLLGMDNDEEAPGFNTTLDWEWLYNLIDAGVKRIPELEKVEIKTGWAGLYDQSPDCSAVIGESPGFNNFFILSGFSGHGFMQGPIAAKLFAEKILTGKSSIDISQFAVDRFEKGQRVQELNVI
ncbi:MAG: FAD-binding oxidoreductase, partial [Planctomycetes bacterium]|nr:FAD-binding oxidoreductase [Planctomycetota bacterium]